MQASEPTDPQGRDSPVARPTNSWTLQARPGVGTTGDILADHDFNKRPELAVRFSGILSVTTETSRNRSNRPGTPAAFNGGFAAGENLSPPVTVKPAHFVPSSIEHHVEALLLHFECGDFGPAQPPFRCLVVETDGGSDRDFRHPRVRLAYALLLVVTGMIGVILVKPEPRGSKKNPVER